MYTNTKSYKCGIVMDLLKDFLIATGEKGRGDNGYERNILSCKGLPMTAHRRGGTGYDRNTLSCKGLPTTAHRRRVTGYDRNILPCKGLLTTAHNKLLIIITPMQNIFNVKGA